MRFLGIDVATVNAAVATSTGEALACQPPGAKKNAGTRWERTRAMATDISAAVRALAPRDDGNLSRVVGLEDIRFGGGGRYDDAGELRGILKYWLCFSASSASAVASHVLALQPQQWRSVLSIASGLPEVVRYEVYRDRAEALGFVAEGGNKKAREDRTTAFLVAKVTEWAWIERFGDGLHSDYDPGFPLAWDALAKISTGTEEWLL